MKTRIRQLFTTSQFRNGSYMSVVTVVVLAILIVVNMLFAKLPPTVRNVDISSTNIYSVSDITRELLAGLDKDIELIVVGSEDDVDARIRNFISVYEGQSEHLSVSYVDPVLYPSVLTKYDTEAGNIVVRCEETGKQDIIAFDDIIVYDTMSYYYYGQYVEKEFDGDGQLTGAINFVSSEEGKKIYATEGHGEGSLGNSISSLMEKSNLSVDSVNLFKEGAVPEDCELLIINAPAKDFSADEITMIENYMNQGKDVLVMTLVSANTPNMDGLFRKYGIERVQGNIADTRQCYMGNPYYLIPNIVSTEVTSGLAKDSAVLFLEAGGIRESEELPENVSVTAFLKTTASGYAVTENEQVQGTYTLAAYADKVIDEEKTARLTVYTSNSIINEQLLTNYTNLGNGELFLKTVTAGLDDVTGIAIEPVSLELTYNTVTNQGFWGIWMVLVIPLGLLIYGFVRWLMRRKL